MKKTFVLALLLLGAISFAQSTSQPSDENLSQAATKQLIAANGLLRLDMFSQAREEFENFLIKFPSDPRGYKARYGLGISLYQMKQYHDAAAHIDKALQNSKFTRRIEALAILGHCYLASGDYSNAVKTLDKYLKIVPADQQSEAVILNRAQAFYMLGDNENALEAFREFTKKYPSSKRCDDAYYFCALSANALQKTDQVVEYLRCLIRYYPESTHMTDSLLLLGQVYQDRGQYDQAAVNFRAMIDVALPKRKVEGYYSLATVLYRSGKYPQAVAALKQIVEKYPSSQYAKSALLQLAHSQYSAGMYDEALINFQKVIDTDKYNKDIATYWKAKTYVALKQNADAILVFRKLIKNETTTIHRDRLYFDTANSLMERQQFIQAEHNYEKVIQETKDPLLEKQSLYRSAWCLHQAGRYDQSAEICRTILAGKYPDIIEPAMILLAENLFKSQKYSDAEVVYEKLVETKKDDKILLLRWAQCAYLNDKFVDVVKRIGTWTDNDPTGDNDQLRQGLFMLGHSQLKARKYFRAAKTLKLFLTKTGEANPQAMFYLFQAYRKADMNSDADVTLARLFEIDKDLENIWSIRGAYELARQEYLKKDKLKARYVLEKIVASKAKVPAEIMAGACYMLGWIDFNSGAYSKSIQSFSKVYENWPDYSLADECLYHQAVALDKLGQYDAAMKFLDEYIDKFHYESQYHQARILRGLCLAKLNKKELALKELAELESDPNTQTAGVFYQLAWLRREKNNRDGAIRTYQNLLRKFPDDALADSAKVELSELLFEEKEFGQSIGLLRKVVSNPKTVGQILELARYRLGFSLVKDNKPAEASDVFTSYIKDYPQSEYRGSALFEVAGAYVTLGEFEKSLNFYDQFMKEYPKHKLFEIARLKYAQTLAVCGDFEQSLTLYQTYLKNNPKSELKYLADFGIGWAYENLNNPKEAMIFYQKVTDNFTGPTAARAQLQIGRILFNSQRYRAAAKELVKVDLVYPPNSLSAQAIFEAAKAFEEAGDLDFAKELYARCARKYKGSDPAEMSKNRLNTLIGTQD